MNEIFQQVGREVTELYENIHRLPVVPQISSQEIRRHLKATYGSFEAARPLHAVTEDVIAMLATGNLQVTHPRYFGLFNPSVLPAGIVADTLVAAFNPQLAAWSHAPAANEIERFTLRRLASLVGFEPATSIAHFTSGGAEANLTAVLTALAYTFPEHEEGGVAALDTRPLLYVSEESHHSFDKIARMTGLGRKSLRVVPVGADLRLDLVALANQIRSDRARGERPVLIVATAGTTAAGVIDPLAALADFAATEGLWLHVDAAWGGGALLSPRLRPHLEGMERADSVTWDAHKWLSVPMGAGIFLSRHRDPALRAFAVQNTGYMPDRKESHTDPYASTVQWSRRFIGLKLFMALAEHGLDGYARLIEHQVAMGDALRIMLINRGWTVVNETPLPVVCFTHERIERGLVSIADLLRHLYGRGDVWISSVRIRNESSALRACITSFRTDSKDLEHLVSVLDQSLSELEIAG